MAAKKNATATAKLSSPFLAIVIMLHPGTVTQKACNALHNPLLQGVEYKEPRRFEEHSLIQARRVATMLFMPRANFTHPAISPVAS